MQKEIPSISKLLNNPNISSNILDSFYCLEPDLDKYKNVANKEFRRNLRNSLQPYRIKAYGTYFITSEWNSFTNERKNCPYKLSELIFKKYAMGFHYGYFNFEKDILEPSLVFNTDENKAQIIYDYASRDYPRKLENKTNELLGTSSDINKSNGFFSLFYNFGVRRGNYYRAWFLILSNHKIFESFFIKTNEDQDAFGQKVGISLDEKKWEFIYNKLLNRFIHKDTDYNLFKSIFSNESKKVSGKIKWIIKNKQGKPHKTCLREFLTLLLGECPNQNRINDIITDLYGNPIILSKPKKNEYSYYYKELEKIILEL